MSTAIQLVPIVGLDTETQMKVRDIRNAEDVRRWMYTDHEISANEHLAWIHSLKQNTDRIVFVVMDETETPLGVVSADAIDRHNQKADWAFYLTAEARGGLGSALEYAFIEFVFDRLALQKLNCAVLEGNDAVVRQHTKFLFQEEGLLRANINKDGERLGVHLLGLTREDWEAGKAELAERYAPVFDKYRITIQWQGESAEALHPIDQIEQARAKNNLNWMSILRLSLEKSPETAQLIVDDIRRLDREISSLTDKLMGDNPSPRK